MLGFIAADLRRHWIGVLAIAVIVALATALGVVVTLQERALRLGSARAAEAFDLVVGAPGSETQLVLSSVFLQAAPLPLLPGSVLAGLRADPRVVWAAPLGFGDYVGETPIVGTTADLVDGLGGVAEGAPFTRRGDAVLGADVAMPLGESFSPIHGQLAAAGQVHTGSAYTAVGRLARTGSSWDKAVLVPIEGVWGVHGLGVEAHADHAEGPAPLGAAPTDLVGPGGGDGHAHGALDAEAPIDPATLDAPDAPGVPAIVVKPRTFGDAYTLRQDYRSDSSIAVFPAEVLTRLYGTLGDARLVLGWVAAGAQALVAAAILLVVSIHVLQRRAQVGALRAFGAPRAAVFTIVWGEIFAVLCAGLLAGFAIGYLGAQLISQRLTATSGIALPVVFQAQDTWRLFLLLGLGALAALLPALFAYRQSPAAALRG